jgi:hypothetical protein
MQMGKKTFIIFAGRFHPWHKGHKSVYDYLSTKYGGNEVYITTTDKVELPKSPFNFDEKAKMMVLTGIPSNKIIQVVSNYNVTNLVGKIPIDINRDSLIFAVSEKDMAEDPRFSKFTKKDGSPAYLQPLPKKLYRLEPAVKHGYIDTVPTTQFTALGKPARSASELRKQYVSLTPKEKKLFITDLFGKYSDEVKQIMDTKLGAIADQLTEKQKQALKTIIAGIMKEDQASVDTATHKTNLAFKKQREEELKLAKEKLRSAEEKANTATSTEEKDVAEKEVDNAKKNVKSKEEMYKAASAQARSQ